MSLSSLPRQRPVFITPPELADRHHTSTGHLANLRAQGRGVPFVRFSSRKVAYPLAAVEAWEAERFVSTVSAA